MGSIMATRSAAAAQHSKPSGIENHAYRTPSLSAGAISRPASGKRTEHAHAKITANQKSMGMTARDRRNDERGEASLERWLRTHEVGNKLDRGMPW